MKGRDVIPLALSRKDVLAFRIILPCEPLHRSKEQASAQVSSNLHNNLQIEFTRRGFAKHNM